MLNGRYAKVFSLCLLGTSIASMPAATAGDVVTDWGAKAVAIGAEKQMPNSRFSRGLAMMHVAMFDAVNAIDRRYKPYTLDLVADKGASREAAAAAAAYVVLINLFPDEKTKLEQALQTSLAAIENDAKTKGIELGRKSAAGIITLRADDGSNAQESYRPFTKAGVYVHTALPIESTSGTIKPWTMENGSQFRPQSPPALDSEVWTRDVNEIRELGGINSKTRTPEQTEIGRFWFLTGPRTYTPLVQQVVEAKEMDLVDCARLYALVSMATSDAFISIFDAKYAHNFWRPITAIRNADLTSNPATPRDASWSPLGTTPPHPEYPCAHCIVAAAVTEVLQRVAGDDVGELTLTSAGVTRKWKRLEDYRNEVSLARIYAGFHYRFSTEAAKSMGRKIGELVTATQLLHTAGHKTAKQ
ncbi:MAG: vanadium-dependent haloperoxidase [Hyphomicrobiaceae bacterium]